MISIKITAPAEVTIRERSALEDPAPGQFWTQGDMVACRAACDSARVSVEESLLEYDL